MKIMDLEQKEKEEKEETEQKIEQTNSYNLDNKNEKRCECNKDKETTKSDISQKRHKIYDQEKIKKNDQKDKDNVEKNKFEDLVYKLEDNNKKLEESYSKLENDLIEVNKNLINERLRYKADLDNFQKRMIKENEKDKKYASVNLIKDILVPFEQLEKVLETETKDNLLKNFLSGFKMIYQQIKEILEKNGVKEIKSLGEKFNPELHYAISKISDKNQPNNTNVLVLQKGFLYKELVIRPAMVKINKWSDNNEESIE